MQSWVYKQGLNQGISQGISEGISQGISQGREEGLAPLLHLFARRLGRPLSEAEHGTVLARFDAVGPDRLGDAALDLTPAEFAAWLADPAAR